MSDERDPARGADPDPARDPDTDGFDADDWFRQQFGGEPPPPASTPVALPPPPLVKPPFEPPSFEQPATEPMAAVDEPPAGEPLAVEHPATMSVADQSGRPINDAATELMRTPEEGGALDELFGTEQFREYQEEPMLAVPRSSRRGSAEGAAGGTAEGGDPPPRATLTKNQKILLWIAGALVALLALVALFFVGTRIPDLLGPAPGAEASPTPTPTPTPTETARPVGPVLPGEYRWDELWGGECLEPFPNAWQDEFTVVDCAIPHAGQLVARVPFPLPEGATEQGPFPGEEALAAQISLLCSSPGVIDLAAAGAFTDIQLQGAFAVTEEQWDDGLHDYFCFVSRSSGEPLTGSLAIPPAPPAS